MPMFEAKLYLDKKMEAVMKDYGHEVANRRHRVLCKCETQDEAEQMFKKVALVGQWDMRDCCSEVRDERGMNILRETDLAVCTDGDSFFKHDDIRDALLR
jgi:phage major head subunit gpT-like protein